MKLKALVAAMALASGVANAGYATFTDATQAGSLAFTMYNSTSSALFDLGLTSAQFSFANVGGIAADCTSGCAIDKQITWNFNTGTVTSTGAADLSALVAGVSGDWAAAWAAYSSNVSSSSFAVFAGDRDGTATTAQHYLTTSASAATAVANTSNTNLLNFNSVGNWYNAQQLTGGGNHDTVANGANVISDNTSVLWQGANGGLKSNWNGNAPFTATGATTAALDFYGLDGKAGGSTLKVNVTNYNGKFELNAAAGTLTYTTLAAVPEASTYAMLLAGLGLMGLMARRRAR